MIPRKRKRIVVVGGGPGGLCSAMLLQARGFDVTVLESRGDVGGRSGALKLGPYTFDVGSTMLMMPFVAEEMFALAGRDLRREVELMPIDPMYRLDFGDRALDVFRDPVRMRAELERFSPGSSEGLGRFLSKEAERLGHLYPVLQESWPNLGTLLRPLAVGALPWVGLARSLYQQASEYFDDEALRLAFSFQSAYLGMSPWECPAGFGMVPFVEHAWGIDHVRGGVHRLCSALARVATELGATVRTGARVKRLVVEGERCTAVELDGGEQVPCDDVVVNADGARALDTLLEQRVSLRFNHHRLEHLAESCSTYMLYLGVDRPVPLRHHTVFFARDYRAEMKRIFRQGLVGEDLSLYVCNPAATDPTMAPEGHCALYVLALVPNTRFPLDWNRQGPALRDTVLDALKTRAGLELEGHVKVEASLTPTDWETDFAVSHGAVFGPTHRITQLLAFRLPNQLPSPSNVYLAGGATSPGSGLPTILESARIASRLVCERHGVAFPPSAPLPSLVRRPAA